MQEKDFGDGGEGPRRLCLRAPAASAHRALQQPQLPARVAGAGLVRGGHRSPSPCTSPDLDIFLFVFFFLSTFSKPTLNFHMKSRFVFLLKQRNLNICPESVGSVESVKCATETWRRQIAVNMLLHTRTHIVAPAVHYSQPLSPFFSVRHPSESKLKQNANHCKKDWILDAL